MRKPAWPKLAPRWPPGASACKSSTPVSYPRGPASPNMPLNLMAALLLGLVLSILYLTLEFSYGQRKAESMRRSLRVASHG